MKIGIMGSHGTGKTTLALRLAAEMKQREPGKTVSMVAETARNCPWPINKATTEEAQRWIFLEKMRQELEASRSADIVVCDRTVLDNLAYAERAGLFHLVMDFFHGAIRWMKTNYDRIHFLRPAGVPIAADGFRDTDPDFQAEIDVILCRWVARYEIPITPVE